MKKLVFLALIAGGAAVAVQWPEIHRYLRVREM
ncbi:MAG: hypothetical protein ACFB50_12345 [Rubrobacteraceae bacterium]